MSWRLHALTLRRLRYRAGVRGTGLEKCWQTHLPSTASDWRRCSFLACDAEMSSMDPGGGELLSLGWIGIEQGIIRLDSAEHHLLSPENTVGQSATIHNLRDCEFEQAQTPAQVVERFLQSAAGHILVFHNASLDLAFLDKACRQLYGAPLLLPHVDTLSTEHSLMVRRDQPVKSGDLRLQACRDHYNLPVYPAHNALRDALATAELLLAQLEHRDLGGGLKLGSVLN